MSPIWSFQHSQSGCSSFWCIVRITLYLTKRLAVLGVHERLEMTGGAGCTMKVDRRGEYFCVGPLHSKFHHCSMLQLWHIHQKHLLHGCLCAYRRVYIDPPRNHGTHFRNICWLFVVFVVFATWFLSSHVLPFQFWVHSRVCRKPWCSHVSWTHGPICLVAGWIPQDSLARCLPSQKNAIRHC